MTEKIFKLEPWTPEVKNVAENLINTIKSVVPELEVLFMGAAALELPGKNDIDLDILCDHNDITYYCEKLIPILGMPKEINNDLAAWNYEVNGFEIDLILSDPKTSHVPIQQKVFENLKNNNTLKEEYKKLKIECDGVPYAEYERRKIEFFENKILSNED